MTMKPVDMTEDYWGVSPDDPYVVQALAVYDNLNEDERRDTYRNVIVAMAAYRKTGDPAWFVKLTEIVELMVRMDAVPGHRERMRAQRTAPPPEPCDPAALADLLRRLDEGAA